MDGIEKIMAGMVAINLDRAAEIDPSNPGAEPPTYGTEAVRYAERNRALYQALGFAVRAGYPCGFRIEPGTPDWPVLFIELPTGQVSWHLPQFPEQWDGHTTEEKYKRVKAFSDQIQEAL